MPINPIDEYVSRFPEETQEVLSKIRSTIKKIVPEAEETISYGVPTFKMNGTYVIYFAGYAKHISIYPVPRGSKEFGEELSKYKGGKGTAQFPLDKPVPYDLIERLTKYMVKENINRSKKK